MKNSKTKEIYTLAISIVFIGIGGYKLYQKFYLDEALAVYQWMLAAGLVGLGIYQLVTLYIKKNRVK
jgi:hypothetical protein